METEFMGMKISANCRPIIKRGHNLRDPKIVRAEKHIDPSRPHETVLDMGTMQECYEKIFGDAVRKYNAKQKRADRKIVNYLVQILSDKRKGKHKNIKADSSRKAAYEMILKIGRAGNCPDHKKASEILKAFCLELQKLYPKIYIIGIYLHDDEFYVDQKTGAVMPSPPHVHVDFIYVAHLGKSLKTGMELQSSMSGALAEMGFKTCKGKGTAQIQFEEAVRAALQNYAEARGIKVDRTPGEKHSHMEKSVYQQMRENQKERERLDLQKESVNKSIQAYNQAVTEFNDEQQKSLAERKQLLEKKQKQLEIAKEQELRQKELDQQERDLRHRESMAILAETTNDNQAFVIKQKEEELAEREKIIAQGEAPVLEKLQKLEDKEKLLKAEEQASKKAALQNALLQNDLEREKQRLNEDKEKAQAYLETKKEVEQNLLTIESAERDFMASDSLPLRLRVNRFVSSVKKIVTAAVAELTMYKNAFKSFWTKKASDFRLLADSLEKNGCATFADYWSKRQKGLLDWQAKKTESIELKHQERKNKIIKGESYGIDY